MPRLMGDGGLLSRQGVEDVLAVLEWAVLKPALVLSIRSLREQGSVSSAAVLSCSAAPVWQESTRTPDPFTAACATMNSLAVRFIPSWREVTQKTSAAR